MVEWNTVIRLEIESNIFKPLNYWFERNFMAYLHYWFFCLLSVDVSHIRSYEILFLCLLVLFEVLWGCHSSCGTRRGFWNLFNFNELDQIACWSPLVFENDRDCNLWRRIMLAQLKDKVAWLTFCLCALVFDADIFSWGVFWCVV